VKRRLAAILAADVVGFSRLMGEDEAGTLARLKSLRKELVQPKIAEGRGRIVKLMGDGLLAEFASVVEAVRCAVDIQQDMAGREPDLPDERRIRLRIGVNLGDIIVEGSDIYGDGVNVAARLEGLAEPGGICISGKVYEEVRGKLDLVFDDLGDQTVKNITRPVRAYHVRFDGPGRAGDSPLPLPDKPSIAVLPFTNMSGDAEQEYFSDGITEDIITELSRFRSLFVTARNSSFQYKGRSPKVQDVGRQLGVAYIVEGSVRKAANRVRVTAQLVEAATGNHLWAERYDRELDDIFAVQDDVVATIVSTVGGRVDVAGKVHAARMSDASLRAYDLYLRAAAAQDRNTKASYQQAEQYLERAIELDPGLARAYHHLSLVRFFNWMAHWVEDRETAFANAFSAARKAVALDDTDSGSHAHLGMLHLYRREFDAAERHCRKAISLNPNDFRSLGIYGLYLTAIGQPGKAVEQFDQATRLNPLEPDWFNWLRGIAYFTAGRYEEAISDLKSIETPVNEVRGWLAASYAHAGRADSARASLEEFLRTAKDDMAVFPGRELVAWETYWHAAIEYRDQMDFDRLFDGLRKAGMSE
jgi:adenylate cyclase